MLPHVGVQTAAAVLASVREDRKAPAASLSQGIEGAIAEQVVKAFRLVSGVAGKIFALLVLKKGKAPAIPEILCGITLR